EPARLSGPWLRADELADFAAHRFSVGVVNVHRHAERRRAERARLGWDHGGLTEKTSADLGAARDVDDRDVPLPHRLRQTAARLWVPRLARRPHDPQLAEVVFLDGIFS